MCPGTARRPLRHLRCTLKIVSLACLVDREEERKGLGCCFAQGQMRHTSHCFYSAVFAQRCECAVKHTEEIGSCRGASGVSWSVAYLEFHSECQPGVPWNSEQRRKHLLLLLRLKRAPLLLTWIWRPLRHLLTPVRPRDVLRSAPGGEKCEVILFVRSNASLSARGFIHPSIPQRCHVTGEVWSQPFMTII